MSMETLSKQIEDLESEIAVLKERVSVKESEDATALARMQAKLFLEKIFAPYMDGLCEAWGVSPEEGLRRLVTQKVTFDKIAADNPADLAVLMSQRELQVMVDIASPLRDVSDEWVTEKMGVLFDVMAELRPELARVIVETPGGMEWFTDSLTGLRKLLFGGPQIKIEPQ